MMPSGQADDFLRYRSRMPTIPLAAVVGANAQRLRVDHGVTTDQLARTASVYGLKWSDSRVSAMERGKVAPTLPTLFALAQALGDVTGERVSIVDLVWSDGWVELNPDLIVRGDALTSALSGAPIHLTAGDVFGAVDRMKTQIPKLLSELKELPEHLDDTPITAIEQAERHAGVTEERVAKDLGIGMVRMHHESAYLWGDSFSRERDRRAGPDANAQKKGQITRQMKAELKESLARGDRQ